jgi:hypothetical protein
MATWSSQRPQAGDGHVRAAAVRQAGDVVLYPVRTDGPAADGEQAGGVADGRLCLLEVLASGCWRRGLRVHSAAKLRKQGQEEAATLRKRLEEEKAAALQNQ